MGQKCYERLSLILQRALQFAEVIQAKEDQINVA